MRLAAATTLIGTFLCAITGYCQEVFRCNDYRVEPIILTGEVGYYIFENSGDWRYVAEDFEPSPDMMVSILDLGVENTSVSWFHDQRVRGWTSGLGGENNIPSWLTVEELEPIIGPIETPWVLYYGPNYAWFQIDGSMETGQGEAEFSFIFSLASTQSSVSESTLDVYIWPQWLICNIGEVSIDLDWLSDHISERPRGVLHLDFSSPGSALVSFSGSPGLFEPQTEAPMTDLIPYDSFFEMLKESFAWLAIMDSQNGWRTNTHFGFSGAHNPMKSWGWSPYNDLIIDLLVLKAAWRGRDDPEGLAQAEAEAEAKYNLAPGTLPSPGMQLITGAFPNLIP